MGKKVFLVVFFHKLAFQNFVSKYIHTKEKHFLQLISMGLLMEIVKPTRPEIQQIPASAMCGTNRVCMERVQANLMVLRIS